MNRKQMLARLKKGEDPLELSIEKWQDIVNQKRKNPNFGERNCALCEEYGKNNCEGCPVYLKTKAIGCANTPYEDYYEEYEYGEKDHKTLAALAQKELEFLKTLRKKKAEP